MALNEQYTREYIDDVLWLLADLDNQLQSEVSEHGGNFLRVMLAQSGLTVAFKYFTESRNESGLAFLTRLMRHIPYYDLYYSKLESSYKAYYTDKKITPRFENLHDFLSEISSMTTVPYYLIDETDSEFLYYRELFNNDFCSLAHSLLVDCYNMINGNEPFRL